MEQPFRNVLDYIKNLFSINPVERTRKRSAGAPIFETRTKLCRLSPYSKPTTTTRYIPIHRESEDLSPYFPRNFNPVKRLSRSVQRSPMKPVKVQETVVLDDDDDDVIEITKPPRNGTTKKFTSTPLERRRDFANNKKDHENGDDLVFIKTFKSPKEKKKEAKLAGYDYFKPRTSLDKPLFTIGSSTNNGTKPKIKPTKYKTLPFKTRGSSTMDYSFRLDDKLKYKQLLDCVSSNDSSIYGTPIGKSFNFEKSRETTKDRIKKVLDNWDNDSSLVIKDSDSEGSVVMVKSPSPKPDIKVDPVNSFRHYVDSSEAAKKDWLTEVVENHKQYVEERQKEIDSLRVCTEATSKINKDINIELLRRKIDQCLQIKDVVLPEIVLPEKEELPELTDEQLSMVSKVHRGDPNEVLATKFSQRVTRRDIMTLAGLNWLNDEVINYYMNMIMERGQNSPNRPKTYAFNTFFYPKLIKDGAQSLRRWTRKVDLFSYDIICVPVHLGMHWCLSIIDFRSKSVRYYDSMGSSNHTCLDGLKKYLEFEHLDKKGTKYSTKDWKFESLSDIPQQMNGSDCGMFACTFAEFITRDAQITFKQEDMPYMRKKMVVEILTGQLLIQ